MHESCSICQVLCVPASFYDKALANLRISAVLSSAIDAQHGKSVKLQVSSPEDTHNFHAAPDAPGAHQVKQKYISTGVFKDF